MLTAASLAPVGNTQLSFISSLASSLLNHFFSKRKILFFYFSLCLLISTQGLDLMLVFALKMQLVKGIELPIVGRLMYQTNVPSNFVRQYLSLIFDQVNTLFIAGISISCNSPINELNLSLSLMLQSPPFHSCWNLTTLKSPPITHGRFHLSFNALNSSQKALLMVLLFGSCTRDDLIKTIPRSHMWIVNEKSLHMSQPMRTDSYQIPS